MISGTKGYAYVPAPWWKTDYFELRYEDQNKKTNKVNGLDKAAHCECGVRSSEFEVKVGIHQVWIPIFVFYIRKKESDKSDSLHHFELRISHLEFLKAALSHSIYKFCNSFQSFLNILNTIRITAADKALTAFTECRAGNNCNFLFVKKLRYKFLACKSR